MKKWKIVLLLTIGMLSLTGCLQPTFSASNKSIVFLNGKAYGIPKGAAYSDPVLTKKQAQLYKKLANLTEKLGDKAMAKKLRYLPCKQGEASWIEIKERDKVIELVKAGKPGESDELKYELKQVGKIGCAKPLSQSEYRYMIYQQNKRVANTKFQQQLNQTIQNLNTNMAIQAAIMTPRTYNVYHHYGY